MPHAADPVAATLFRAAGTAALVGWLLLALTLYLPPLRTRAWALTGVALPAALAVMYVAAFAAGLHGGAHGGFDSIGAVRALFTNDLVLAAGWVHYLAFDLMVGTGITRAGLSARVPRPVLVGCLVLTFLAGPAGLLAYLLVRAVVPAVRTRGASGVASGATSGTFAQSVEVLA